MTTNQKKLQFIYFQGCPNADKVKDVLLDLGYELEEIEQNSLENGNPYKNFSSPTILRNNQILFGAKAEGGGCSLSLPTIERLKELLE